MLFRECGGDVELESLCSFLEDAGERSCANNFDVKGARVGPGWGYVFRDGFWGRPRAATGVVGSLVLIARNVGRARDGGGEGCRRSGSWCGRGIPGLCIVGVGEGEEVNGCCEFSPGGVELHGEGGPVDVGVDVTEPGQP
ncbi:hypothetical protein C0992_001976, partial [Termitomyces sp. T32_za158]